MHRLVCGIKGVTPSNNASSQAIRQVEISVRLRCSPDEFARVATAAEEFLRKLSGDPELRIKYTRPGSIIVVVGCSADAAAQLQALFRQHKFCRLLELEVETVTLIQPTEHDQEVAKRLKARDPRPIESDRELVARLNAHDPEALSELYDRYGRLA